MLTSERQARRWGPRHTVEATANNLNAVLFLPDLDAGGAQRTFVNLANHLHVAGVVPRLVVARADGPAKDWLAPKTEFADMGVSRLRAAWRPLRAIVRRYRPQVLLSTVVHGNILAVLATLGLRPRPALVLRETNSHRSRDDLTSADRLLVRWAYRRADAVIALSHGVAAELTSDYRLDPARVSVIHNPVNIMRFRDPPPGNASPWAADGSLVIGMGRLVRQKGFDLLLKAFARVPGNGLRLAILGEGPEHAPLQRLAHELGVGDRVHIPGCVVQPERWLPNASLFVLSSRWEGFGHVIVEAMAAGAPVVAFDCPYGPADIIRDEETGLLVSNGDVDALAVAMGRVVTEPDLANRLRQAAAADIARFDTAAIATTYAGVLRGCAERACT